MVTLRSDSLEPGIGERLCSIVSQCCAGELEGSTPSLLYEVGTPFSHFAVPQDTLATAQARSVGISDCSFAARETMLPRHVPPTADVALVGLLSTRAW